MTTLSKVRFHLQKNFSLPRRRKLKSFIAHLFSQEGKSLAHIDYIFVTDEALLEINRKHLNHDFYTDIITFDLSESDAIIGEVYISVDRVRENARTYQVNFDEEMHRVIFHGALHLCGYKDKRLSDRAEMRNRENIFLLAYRSY